DLFVLRSLNRICTYFAFDSFSGAYLIGNYGFPKLLGLIVIAADALVYFLLGVGSTLYFTVRDRRNAPMASLLLGIALLYAVPYFVVYSHPHYRHPVEPLLMMLSSGFFVHLLSRKGESLRNIVSNRSALVTLTLVAFSFIQVEFLSIMMLHSM